MEEKKRKPGRPPGSKNKTKEEEVKVKKTTGTGSRLKDEISAIIILALGTFLVVSLQTEAAGQFGIAISLLLKGCFGRAAFILPYYLIIYGLLLFAKRTAHISSRSILFLLIIFLMITLLNSTRFLGQDTNYSFSFQFIGQMYNLGTDLKTGGAFGMVIGLLLIKTIGMTGLYIFSTVAIIISLMLVINTPVSQFLDDLKTKKKLKRQGIEFEEADGVIGVINPAANSNDRKINNKNINEKQLKEKSKESSEDKIDIKTNVTDIPFVKNYPINSGLMTEGQIKILDYMKDDELFEKNNELKIGYGVGLEEIAEPQPGMGLDDGKDNFIEKKTNGEHIGLGEDKNDLTGLDRNKKSTTSNSVKSVDKQKATIEVLKPEELNLAGNVLIKYTMPPIELLGKSPLISKPGDNMDLKAKASKLEQTLHDFNVNAKVVQVTKGPAVTRYEIQPNTGVKVSSIVRLADDIALNLEAKSIRIEAPIPGKAAVGIEVENDRVNKVVLREIIESQEFKTANSKISFAVGKDISGNSIVADLKGMPHMLIAGSTGSGKSVCINSIIISLLFRAKTEEVKFVLIDPKVVELGNYNGIPHLLIPVVTEPSKAAAALNWAVAEMTERYKKFAGEGVRDLESYNDKIKKEGANDKFLPQIVIIIDELADLMMAAPSQVEESICRLAQMARAAGMHLIVATQRPSVDIITGVIKANIPSRISFAVSSQFDSRTILDMSGAEKLVGKGDMLFNPIGLAKPIRVQGSFISDSEVHNVIDYVKSQYPQSTYASDVIHSIEKVQSGSNDDDSDELLPDAIETVVRAEQASVSMIQRRFRIGYNRAARLVDMMEARGIIGPADGSRPRRVLMTEDEYLGLSTNTEEK